MRGIFKRGIIRNRHVDYQREGPLATVTLDDPASGNRVDADMAQSLRDICREIDQDASVRLVVITGQGSVFSVGRSLPPNAGDSTGPPGATGPAGATSLSGASDWIYQHQVTAALAGLGVPVIAALNGDAFDQGLELALAADLRIASADARFGFEDLGQGSILWDGGTQRLPRLIGPAWALDMILTARIIDSRQALEIGLVNRVVPADQLQEETRKLSEKVLAGAPIAARYAKEAVQKGLDLSLEQGLRLEADLNILLQSTADRPEGLQSFLERRDPKFSGQ
jgi:enoyl-CoA hydratase/carnithine racemase